MMNYLGQSRSSSILWSPVALYRTSLKVFHTTVDGVVPLSRCLSSSSNGSQSERPQGIAEDDRDLYLSILQASSTKREARSYIQRYKPSPIEKESSPEYSNDERLPARKLLRSEDNVPGHIYKARNRAYIKNLLRQTRPRAFDRFSEECFAPEIMEEQLHIALVKINKVETLHDDILEGIGRTLKQLRKLGLLAVVVFDIDIDGGHDQMPNRTYNMKLKEEADRVVIGIERSGAKARRVDGSVSIDDVGETQILLPNLIFAPLSRGTIPVLCNTAYDNVQRAKCTTSNEILLALTKMVSRTDGGSTRGTNVISLDRIIVLDPSGGIPSSERKGAHVFVNLEQEYDSIQADLKELSTYGTDYQTTLQTLRDCLKILPPTSSALVTTPLSASSAYGPGGERNLLIYNLLTDKPAFSPSLPISPSLPRTTTTLLKHGIPLTVIPSGSFDNGNRLSKHPQIDLPKLVTLIEDSFGKKLDVDHYLRRVDNRMAGVIIGGDYDGAALITWEEGSNGRKVPYLDKFAVARKAQGLGGVADVVFKAMILGKGMFRNELLWRSRKDNPVNKWYFERSKGTYKLPQDRWTMFWTTDGILENDQTFQEYLKICETVVPSLHE